MKVDAGAVMVALAGLAAVVAAAYVGLGQQLGSVVLAVVGLSLVIVGLWAAWPEGTVRDDVG